MKCHKCGVDMKPGKALMQTFRGIGDFHDDDEVMTISPGGPGKMVDCLKCPECGRSAGIAAMRARG